MSKRRNFDPAPPRQPEQFREVEDAHVIPKFWLKQFASQGQIQTVRPKRQESRTKGISAVGTRPRFYSRERPDETRLDDFEWSLSQLENVAAPALRQLESDWPLSDLLHKATLAQLFGLQIMRGPDYRRNYDRLATDALTKGFIDGSGINYKALEDEPNEGIVPVGTSIAGDTKRLLRMNFLSAKLAAALGSMTWTLLQCSDDELALSDQPVSLWPRGEESRLRRATKIWEVGVANLLEVRVPVSPRLAVLMTWGDRPNDPAPVDISQRQAENVNSFTITGADEEWFYLPGCPEPKHSQGRWIALSAQLKELDGYSDQTAQGSAVRQEVHRRLQARIGEDEIESLDEHNRATLEMIVTSST